MCDKCGLPEDGGTGINTINLCDGCYVKFLHGPEVIDNNEESGLDA